MHATYDVEQTLNTCHGTITVRSRITVLSVKCQTIENLTIATKQPVHTICQHPTNSDALESQHSHPIVLLIGEQRPSNVLLKHLSHNQSINISRSINQSINQSITCSIGDTFD